MYSFFSEPLRKNKKYPAYPSYTSEKTFPSAMQDKMAVEVADWWLVVKWHWGNLIVQNSPWHFIEPFQF